jgi:apolipoprotein N-acyltransferase
LLHRSTMAACVAAMLTGALASLSLPPFGYWPVLFVCLPGLVWLLDGAGAKRSFVHGFVIGWSFSFGYFVPSLWWISEAFWVEPEKFAALIPFAVAGLPSYLALYWGAATGLAARFWDKGWRRVVLVVCLLAVGEWLRGHMLTGFPWNLPGYAAASFEGLSQAASLGGIYALTLLVLLASAGPAAFCQAGHSTRDLRRSGLAFAGAIAAIVTALQVWGGQRVAGYDAITKVADPQSPAPLVRIVQPSIPQNIKWDRTRRNDIVSAYLEMTARPWPADLKVPPLVVWPESALPLLLAEEDDLRKQIAELLPKGSFLLTGGLHRVMKPDGTARIFNSLLVIGPGGQIMGRHDKVRLVPFGEFLPFPAILEPLGIRQLARLPSGFSEGEADKVVTVPGMPAFAGFICYEAVFPRSFPRETLPKLLVNVTNDAWFGTSGGPHQHLVQARFRSIEQGVPMIRAANTGISAMIDPVGRVQARLPLFETGILEAALPATLPVTLYAMWGDALFAALAIAFLTVVLICRLNNL